MQRFPGRPLFHAVCAALLVWLAQTACGIGGSRGGPTPGAGAPSGPATQTLLPASAVLISQTRNGSSAWLGDSEDYVSVGEGQSFRVAQPGVVKQFAVWLSAGAGDPATDTLVCELRNADLRVLERASLPGFSSGGGWQVFGFDTRVEPGIYVFTCYLVNTNRAEPHYYNISGNLDDNSYPDGTRYDSRGGHPQDANTWSAAAWDLDFKIVLEP